MKAGERERAKEEVDAKASAEGEVARAAMNRAATVFMLDGYVSDERSIR